MSGTDFKVENFQISSEKKVEILDLFFNGDVGEDGLRDNSDATISKKVGLAKGQVSNFLVFHLNQIEERVNERVNREHKARQEFNELMGLKLKEIQTES